MPRHRFSLKALMAVMGLAAILAAFIGKVGVNAAFQMWWGVLWLTTVIWVIPWVLSDTRGRIRFFPLLLGAMIASCVAGLIVVNLFSLEDLTITNSERNNKLGTPPPASPMLFETVTVSGAIIGLLASALGSWVYTGSKRQPENHNPTVGG